MKNLFSLLMLLVVSLVGNAQAPSIEWQKCLGGTGSESAASIQKTDDGGYIVAGGATSIDGDVTGNHGSGDYWVVKLNDAGIIEWQKSYGGTGNEDATSIQQTTDGGYIVAGRSNLNDGDVSGNHGANDYWIVKLDNTGLIQWQKSFGGSNTEEANSIIETTDGGYIVAGTTYSWDGDVVGNHSTPGYPDCWIVKLDNAGNMQWQKPLGGTNNEVANSIKQTIDGGYIVAGYSQSNDGDVTGHHGSSGSGYYDCWIVKLDNVGTIQWQKSLGGTESENASEIIQTNDGGYIIAGGTNSNDGDVTGNHGSGDCWIAKLDNIGTIEWQKSLGGSMGDMASNVSQTTDGGYIIAGESRSTDGDATFNNGLYDYWIIKLDSNGNIQWQKSLGGSAYDYSRAEILEINDGGYLATGTTVSTDGDVTGNHGGGEFWVVKLAPTNIPIASNPVSAGSSSSLAICNDNTVQAWGGNLGNGTSINNTSNVPVQVSFLTGITSVVSGTTLSLALKNDSTVWAWGTNEYGQLGNGSNINSNVPVQVSGLTGIIAIGTEGYYRSSLALKNDGTVWAWGNNQWGQLGNGSNIDSNVPVQVSNLTGVVGISGGDRHALALKNNGTVWAWGFNQLGQFGNGTNTDSNVPVQISSLSGIIAISGGGPDGYSLAIKNDGTVWAWGYNYWGQLGNGTNTISNIPVQVSSLTGVIAVAGGWHHSLAVKNDGTVWAWGSNDNGQLGNGTNTDSNIPVQVSSLTDIIAIAAGADYSLAMKNDNTVWAWGWNLGGELGNGTNTASNIPVQVTGFCSSSSVPIAAFTASAQSITTGGTVTFTDQSQNTTSYSWTFEGGTPSTSTDQNPIIVYNTPGTYDVSLTVTNGVDSDTHTETDYITVSNCALPSADFTPVTATINVGEQVTFTDQSTNNPTSWSWIFTGGTPATSCSNPL